MASPSIPFVYKLFFLYIEPISTIVGFVYAWFYPVLYLTHTHAASAPGLLRSLPVGTHVVLRQLGNLYLGFTLNEALVLRSTTDLTVWRTLLFGLLVADFGHLYACALLGWEYLYDVAHWDAMAWGNIGFVYMGATLRSCFLLGVGFAPERKAKTRARKSIKAQTDDESAGMVSPTSLNKTPAQSTRRRKSRAAVS